jgi:hypothetical protein
MCDYPKDVRSFLSFGFQKEIFFVFRLPNSICFQKGDIFDLEMKKVKK